MAKAKETIIRKGVEAALKLAAENPWGELTLSQIAAKLAWTWLSSTALRTSAILLPRLSRCSIRQCRRRVPIWTIRRGNACLM